MKWKWLGKSYWKIGEVIWQLSYPSIPFVDQHQKLSSEQLRSHLTKIQVMQKSSNCAQVRGQYKHTLMSLLSTVDSLKHWIWCQYPEKVYNVNRKENVKAPANRQGHTKLISCLPGSSVPNFDPGGRKKSST